MSQATAPLTTDDIDELNSKIRTVISWIQNDRSISTTPQAKVLEESCEDLLQAIRGPDEHLLSLVTAHRIIAALQYTVHFDLASHIPDSSREDGVRYSDVAAQAGGIPERDCSRVLRLLMTCGLFHEPRAGFVAHNDASLPLLDVEMKEVLRNMTDEPFKASAFLAQAAERGKKRTDAPLNLAFGTELPMFEYFAAEAPWRAKRFGRVMGKMAMSPRLSLGHLKHGFAWENLPASSTVVDVGGSIGHCARAILEANPGLRCIVQDIATARGQESEIEFMEYNFWNKQPVSADIYFLRWILHDYPDEEASQILRNQVTAMKAGSKLVIMERVIETPGTKRRADERNDRMMDIGMWTLLNGVERDLKDWEKLLREADPRLRLESVVSPTGSALSLLVASLKR